MANYKHILLAADLSDDFEPIISRALEIRQQNRSKLTLIHVVEYPGEAIYTGEIPLPENFDLEQRMADQAKEKLSNLAKWHRLSNHEELVEIGSPKREIVRIAEEQNVDLIIIGSHGRHGLKLLLGATANGVLHLAPCDVLAVRVVS